MVVDDDPASRKLLSSFLTPIGCVVRAFGSGEEAVRAVEEEKWDLIFLDINMPGMDGFAVLECVRRTHPVGELPVIMVTGQSDSEAYSRGLSLRANDFILKQAELLARAGNILAMHWARMELAERVAELEEAQQTNESLVQAVIHDIRGSVTNAMSFLHLAAEHGEFGSDLPAAGLIRKALESMAKSIEIAGDVLDTARLERRQLVTQSSEVDLCLLGREKAESVRLIAEMHGISLEVSCASLAVICTDARLAGRVLDNLLLNAIGHAPAGGKIRLAVEPATDRHGTLVSLRADGEGIPPQALLKLFDKAAQPEMRRRGITHGTGPGLFFCRLAVEALGGRIWAANDPGGGVSFFFTFPAELPDSAVSGRAAAVRA